MKYFCFIHLFLLRLFFILNLSEFSESKCHVTHSRSSVFDHKDDHSHSTTEKSLDITTQSSKILDLIETTTECPPCSEGSICVPPVQCPAHVWKPRSSGHSITCHLSKGREGICCSTGQNHTVSESTKMRRAFHIDRKSILDARTKSKLRLSRLMEKQEQILSNEKHKTLIRRGTPSFGHFQSLRSVNRAKSAAIGMSALQNLFTMQTLKERQGINKEDILMGVELLIVEDGPCPSAPNCHNFNTKYRSLEGTCNNINHPTWGAAGTATERLLPPNYHDGMWEPRMSVTKTPLKSPRTISSTLLPDKDRPHSMATLLLMQFGQFVTHDITLSVALASTNGSAISCCTEDGSAALPPEQRHFGCLPIDINPNDPFYKHFNQRCMNFVRTQLAPNHDCSLGYAKQMNGVSQYLDLSQIYGSDPETISPLRDWSGGRLRMFTDFGRDLLPLSDDQNDCITMEQGSACFRTGDNRGNQIISLVAVHTLFNREHNRIAGQLAALNPHWSEQLVFLEARKIVIAEYQHIVFNEYLPLIIGDKAMSDFGLYSTKSDKYSIDYHSEINPSLTAEFVSAAFRFGHSTVDGKLKILKKSEVEEMLLIPDVMFHPSRMRVKGFFDKLLNGLTSQPMQYVDPSISEQLSKYMFRAGNPFGIDLASLNIQRGRDHGLRSYNDYRELVGLTKINNFGEFGDKISEHLKMVYASPDDIDLWIGGLLEVPEDGAIVGFTFREIIADQFSRLKKGDRYFYEYSPEINPGFFTIEQLAQIKKASMARIICDNSDHIELFFQSPKPFIKPDVLGNDPLPCMSEQIPSLDLSAWKEF